MCGLYEVNVDALKSVWFGFKHPRSRLPKQAARRTSFMKTGCARSFLFVWRGRVFDQDFERAVAVPFSSSWIL
jgi:hypothetical protein